MREKRKHATKLQQIEMTDLLRQHATKSEHGFCVYHDGWSDEKICQIVGCSINSVAAQRLLVVGPFHAAQGGRVARSRIDELEQRIDRLGKFYDRLAWCYDDLHKRHDQVCLLLTSNNIFNASGQAVGDIDARLRQRERQQQQLPLNSNQPRPQA